MVDHELNFNDSGIDTVLNTVLEYHKDRVNFEIKFYTDEFDVEEIENSFCQVGINVDPEFPESPLDIEFSSFDHTISDIMEQESYCIRAISFFIHNCSNSKGLIYYKRIHNNEFKLRFEFK